MLRITSGDYAMASKIEVIAWDSCVIIDALQGTGKKLDLSALVKRGQDGHLQILISELSIIECSHLKASNLPKDDQHKLLDAWFESPFIIRQAIHPGITRRAIAIARQHELTASDAIILATAEYRKVGVLHTGDGKGKKQGKKLLPLSGKIGDPPISIMEPDAIEPGKLFSS